MLRPSCGYMVPRSIRETTEIDSNTFAEANELGDTNTDANAEGETGHVDTARTEVGEETVDNTARTVVDHTSTPLLTLDDNINLDL